jgi:hypothetical protein
MPGTPTPILNLTVPTIGGDSNSWGQEINNNLSILDNLGAVTAVNINFNQSIAPTIFPEMLARVSTGSLTITVTVPAPSTVLGKIFTVKKVDAGLGQINVVTADGSLIDGVAAWQISNQYSFVRMASMGAGYDVIGVG